MDGNIFAKTTGAQIPVDGGKNGRFEGPALSPQFLDSFRRTRFPGGALRGRLVSHCQSPGRQPPVFSRRISV